QISVSVLLSPFDIGISAFCRSASTLSSNDRPASMENRFSDSPIGGALRHAPTVLEVYVLLRTGVQRSLVRQRQTSHAASRDRIQIRRAHRRDSRRRLETFPLPDRKRPVHFDSPEDRPISRLQPKLHPLDVSGAFQCGKESTGLSVPRGFFRRRGWPRARRSAAPTVAAPSYRGSRPGTLGAARQSRYRMNSFAFSMNKLPYILGSAPFTPEQRSWLNGYLAGLFADANVG